MKLSNCIITLCTIASATALPFKRAEKCNNEILSMLQSCNSDCSVFSSEKCQNFFSNPFDIDSGCDTLSKEEKNTLYITVKEKQAISSLYCYKDTDGNQCPFINVLNNKDNLTEEAFMKIITDTCKSENCVNLTVEAISQTLNTAKYIQSAYQNYLDWYENGIQYLQTQCIL
ncbi:hypothetical protein PIROE2DRAFT_9913 [Piromyces sp. E2]|nr:hypothetical protein PIROE2DRAFT_9913 [Piromyces sp. E2]|eukprot:OUM63497.1 hypothetical protein PIROE2DRAFT_9913 [Piromyces sp. E2]